MKRFFLILMVVSLGSLMAEDAIGQRRNTRRATPRRTNTQRVTTPQTPVETPVVAPAEVSDTLPLPAALKSRRPNTTVEGDYIKDKTPLPYDQIRKDDEVYRQVIWREISVKEKMNLPFKYDGQDEYGSQRLFNILLRHIKEGDLTAFSNVNDRFTSPLKTGEIATMLAGASYTITKPDFDKDPDGSKGIMKDTVIRDEFDENSIAAYRIKEEIIFDRETSRLHFRILGVAPVKEVKNEDGSVRGGVTLFWLYYPDMRPVLAKYEAYNPRNMALRMSWEEIFESRYFSSFIYKSTLNNPTDMPLTAMIKDPLMRLLEGENIKNTIFDWEQNQWSY